MVRRNITAPFVVFPVLESIVPVRPFRSRANLHITYGQHNCADRGGPCPQGSRLRVLSASSRSRGPHSSRSPRIPKWLGMLALTTAIILVGSVLPMTTEGGQGGAARNPGPADGVVRGAGERSDVSADAQPHGHRSLHDGGGRGDHVANDHRRARPASSSRFSMPSWVEPRRSSRSTASSSTPA